MRNIRDDENGVEISGKQFSHHEKLGDGIIGFDIAKASGGKGCGAKVEEGDEVLDRVLACCNAGEGGFPDAEEAVKINGKGEYDEGDVKGYEDGKFSKHEFFMCGLSDPVESEVDEVNRFKQAGDDQDGFIQQTTTFIVPVEQEDHHSNKDNDEVFVCDL
jgi:hypothetical protein